MSSPWPAAPPPGRGGVLAWLRTTATLVRARAFLKRTPEDHRRAAATAPGGEMPRVLSRADLTLLSLGSVVGAGVFVLTGVAAADHGGPSVVLAYLLAGGTALLSALCYTEFAASMPVTGGSVVYVGCQFGELAAVIVAAQLLLEYVLSIAACARAATAYGGALLGLAPGAGLIHVGRLVSLDPAAAALVLALAALLARGTAQSASVNATVTLVSLFAALYVLAAGAPLASAANLTPFFPGGARGVFGAASIVFFAFVGFDTVAAAAEEARDPAADLPFAILVSVAAAALLYAALAAVLVAAVPRAAVDHGAPFAAMFSHAAARAASPAGRVLLATSARFVSFGALTGILTAGLVTQLGVARVVVFLARERLLPVALAAVDPGTGAPAAATWAANGVAAALALTTDLGDLAALVSVGTLSVFLAVAAAVLKRRHSPPGGGARSSAALVALLASSAAVSAALTFGAPAAGAAAAGVAWCASAGAFYLLPVSYLPSGFRVPLAPLTPALAVLATVHLALSLGTPAYVRLAVWTGVACLFYACFSVHSADAADAAGGRAAVAAADAGDAVSLELALASLPPPPRRGASGDDRARLLTVVRLASDDGLAEPRTPAAGLRLEVPPTPTGGVGSSAASSQRSSVGEEGGGGRRGGGGASRLSQ